MIISHLEEVEDTKGNSGGKGRLYITNLRVIWTSADQFRVNLSELSMYCEGIGAHSILPGIGMKTISKIRTKKVKSVSCTGANGLIIISTVYCRIFEGFQRQFI